MEFDEFVQLCKKLNQEGELTSAGNAPSKAKAAGAPAAGGDFKKVEKKLSIAGMQEGMAQLLKKAGNTLALALTLSLSLVLSLSLSLAVTLALALALAL